MTNQSGKVSQASVSVEAIDRAVGVNVRRIRLLRRITLEQLGENVGVTYQQIQKYERGQNRISCSMLARIIAVLDCSIDDLFEALPGFQKASVRLNRQSSKGEDVIIARAIERVRDLRVRQSVHNLIEALAEQNSADPVISSLAPSQTD